MLSKGDIRLVADRQTCNQIFFVLQLKALGKLDRRAHHLSYQGGPKPPLHTFFVLTNSDCFDLGTSLSEKLCFKSRAICVCDRQTDRQTDRLTDRQTNKHADRQINFAAQAHRPHNTVCR